MRGWKRAPDVSRPSQSTHERVLYELVADTSKVKAGVRWRPPPPSGASGAGGRRGRGGWVASLQRTVASALGLTFQLENLDYSGDTWFHADMTLQNFRAAQAKAKETLFGFVARLSQHAAALDGALSPRSSAQEEVHPAAKAARFLPMPLLLYLILYTVGATASASTLSASCPGVPPRPALADSPVARAVLGFDFGAAAKLLMGAALCDEALAAALSGEAAASSVLLGGRNGAAVDTLEAAMEEGVSVRAAAAAHRADLAISASHSLSLSLALSLSSVHRDSVRLRALARPREAAAPPRLLSQRAHCVAARVACGGARATCRARRLRRRVGAVAA